MAGELNNVRVAFIVSNEGIEQAELTAPWQAVKDAGGTPELLARQAGQAQAYNHLDKADTFPVDRTTGDASASDYDALVLPGGVPNGDQVRTDPAAVSFVKQVVEAGKPVAVICHGGWVLVEADAVRGRTMTSWPSLQTDIRNAGGTWVDEEVHVCTAGPNTIVSSRKPDDLPAFCQNLVEVFSRASAGIS
ncbi:MAG TPA: type 1 glutamine amidotransferase domain-containing protein [Acidimicrobiales bacterium]|nr:type 1 glutamine amidotransferase domain-containing protein [Acidimicrobiales bacterium]